MEDFNMKPASMLHYNSSFDDFFSETNVESKKTKEEIANSYKNIINNLTNELKNNENLSSSIASLKDTLVRLQELNESKDIEENEDNNKTEEVSNVSENDTFEEKTDVEFAKDIIKYYRVNETETDFNKRIEKEIIFEPYIKYNSYKEDILLENGHLSDIYFSQYLVTADVMKKLDNVCKIEDVSNLLSFLKNDANFIKKLDGVKDEENFFIDKLTPLEVQEGYKIPIIKKDNNIEL